MVGSNNTHIVEKNDSARANFKFFYKSKIRFFGVNNTTSTTTLLLCSLYLSFQYSRMQF